MDKVGVYDVQSHGKNYALIAQRKKLCGLLVKC